MRLLEFRHNEPGKGAPANKRTAGSFGAESIVASIPDAAIEDAPRLRVTVAAAPKTGVIPGAVIGVAVDVFNDGTAPAPESKLLISIPVETEYRTGTLRIDGREPQAPEQLFAQGLPIARLPGATSSKVTFQLGVLPGVNTLYLQPRLQTNGVPVVGTAGITIKRGATAAPAEAPRPFYELEDDEVHEIVVTEPILPPVVHERLEAKPEPPPVVEPVVVESVVVEAVVVEKEPEPAPEPEPEPEPPKPAPVPKAALPLFAPPPAAAPKPSLGTATAPPERMVRYRTLANNDVALLDRLFTADVPGIIAHYVLISSIACSEAGDGQDAGGYDAFLRRDIELLGRALVHSRMGKTPQYRIVQNDLDGLAMPWQQATPPQAFPAPRRLRRDLRKPEWQAIAGLIQPSERDATLRTRIALLALAGATLDGVDRRATEESESSLAAYR
ncbi:MAG TPA: hypothetical protein VGP41_08645, partial [Candidatus Lustribacter sp.]|nr:hypothetical protein [Candidatus Lustribacter sp.]